MDRRTLVKQSLVMALGAALPVAAMAQTKAVAGKDYSVLKPAQPTDSGNKIEVIEFFSYGCPHCAELEPVLEAWVKTLPADVRFRRVPITFNREAWAVLARIYLTLDVMGLAEKLSGAVFRGVHVEHVEFGDEVARNEWLKKNGVDAAKFNDSFKSFSVQSTLQRATQIAAAYQINGVPTIAIDGRFLTAPSMTQSLEGTVQVATQLIGEARKLRGGK